MRVEMWELVIRACEDGRFLHGDEDCWWVLDENGEDVVEYRVGRYPFEIPDECRFSGAAAASIRGRFAARCDEGTAALLRARIGQAR